MIHFAALTVILYQQLPDSLFVAKALEDMRVHPVEIVGHDTVPPSARGHTLLDIDRDGRNELFFVIAPKYRQTATVVIYRALDTGGVGRLYEGLAPGSLVPVSGRQIDPHTLGFGVDMTVQGGGLDSAGLSRLLGAARTQGMQVVRYPQFFHVDQRSQAASYIDPTDASPNLRAKTCEGFEFARVDGIIAGHLGTDSSATYLAVITPADLVLYLFRGITPDGRLLKRVWLFPRSHDVASLDLTPTGYIAVVMSSGRMIALAAPQ